LLSVRDYLLYVQSSKLLLTLAGTVVLGFGPRRDPCSFQTFTCFEKRPPL
jgi:hypothetical protein